MVVLKCLLLLQVEPQFAMAEKKNKLLRSVAGGGMDELPQLKTRWDKFEIMMESHQMMIRDQVLPSLTLFFFSMFIHCTALLKSL